MKAIVQDRYGSADVLEFRDIEEPVVGENDVLVRVHAAGCGPDVWHLMTGMPYMARLAIGLRTPKLPVLGWDVAGTVDAVGSNVTGIQPGDEVMGTDERLVRGTRDRARLTIWSRSRPVFPSRRPELFRSPGSRPSGPSATRATCSRGRPC